MSNKIYKISYNEVNSYLVIIGDEACLIDASAPAEMVVEAVGKIQGDFKIKYILLTHGHLNHVRYVSEIKSTLGGAIYLHFEDRSLLHESGIKLEDISLLKGYDKLEIGSIEFVVYHTPGHTDGSVCFYSRKLNALFTGDTLLKGGFGKIWGPHSMSKILRSLKTLSRLIPPETVVYPGHGLETRLGNEAWLDGLDLLS